MKRITNIIFLIGICLNCFADTYTVIFKDGGTANDKTTKLSGTAPEDYIIQGVDMVASVDAAYCYPAKIGYGIKLGTGSAIGIISLTMKDVYKPTKVIVTVAAYDNSTDAGSNRRFIFNGTEQAFTGGIALTDYEFDFDGETDVQTVNISAKIQTSNRFYVSRITIVAPDPHPYRGEIQGPNSIDLGYEHLSGGIAETMTELEFTAKKLAGDISISITDTANLFNTDVNALPSEGGTLQLSFSSSRKAQYSALLTLSATGLDNQPVNKEVPVNITVCSEIYHSGEADDPYTIKDALSRMEEIAEYKTSNDWYHIRGYVASDVSTSFTTGGLSFYLAWENDTIYVYELYGESRTTIKASDIQRDDTLLIRSRLRNNTNSNRKEVYQGELLSLSVTTTDWSQLQPGYYDAVQNSSDTILKRKLGETISGGIRYSYGSGNHHSWDAFYHTDRAEGSMLVLDMYSDSLRYFSADNPTASVKNMDIEHMFPKSWWGGTVNNAYKDLHHLVPADYSANRSKSNEGPGEVVTATFDNGSFKTGKPSAECPATKVFEPADEYKGDFARAYFYILTAYADLSWDMSTPAFYFLDPSSKLLLQTWVQNLLLQWHRQDPVSPKEIRRMAEVSRIQHNRNPYIDYPCLVEYIWGDKQNEAVDLGKLLLTTTAEYDTTDDKSGCTCECKENGSATSIEDTWLNICVIGNTVWGLTEEAQIWSTTGVNMTMLNGKLPEGLYIITSGNMNKKITVR